jgi:hypothetical protein
LAASVFLAKCERSPKANWDRSTLNRSQCEQGIQVIQINWLYWLDSNTTQIIMYHYFHSSTRFKM